MQLMMQLVLESGALLQLFITLLCILVMLLLRQCRRKRDVTYRVIKKRQSVLKKQNYWKTMLNANNISPCEEKKMISVTQLSTCELLMKLNSEELCCAEVLRAYVFKALKINDEFNCITEFITEAETLARELDTMTGNGIKKGPLHGLPFSVKDNVFIKGYDSTVGLTKFIDAPCSEDASIVAALKNLGAIPFCKTNVPQTLLSFGCSNPIFGLTHNPWQKERTSGGSTGGEACLIAAGGSPFGLGSDIGGSARIPPSFCGIPSIKFTSFRLSYHGFRKSAVGCVGIHAVPGILGRDAYTINLISKLLLENSYIADFDPNVLPIPWNELMFANPRGLKIGFYDESDYFPVTPGIKRAIRIAKYHLKKFGHTLVPFTPLNMDYVTSNVLSMFYADRGKYIIEALGNDEIDPLIKVQIKYGIGLPHFVKRIIKPVLSHFAPTLVPCAMAIDGHQLRHTYQLWEAISKQNEYKTEFFAKWRHLGLDLCIGPCFACPAPLIKDGPKLSPAFSYACLYNFMDLPAGIAPVARETESDQFHLKDVKENDLIVRLMKKTTKGALGLPLSVQVIGLPYQEELVLRVITILHQTFNQSLHDDPRPQP